MHDVIDSTSSLVRVVSSNENLTEEGMVNIAKMDTEETCRPHLEGFSDSDTSDSDDSVDKESNYLEQNSHRFYPPTDLLRKCVLERQPSLIRSNSRTGSSYPSSRKKNDSRTFGAPRRKYSKRQSSINSEHSQDGRTEAGTAAGEESFVDFSECDDFGPMIAGQCREDTDVPIMSPPPVVQSERSALKQHEVRDLKFRFARSFTLKILGSNSVDDRKCGFSVVPYKNAASDLKDASEKSQSSSCHCVSNQKSEDDAFCGWVNPYQNGKSKNGRRRKLTKPVSSASAFGRLTGAPSYNAKTDPLGYQHFKDTNKYIERYRFIHSIGKVCAPIANMKLSKNMSDGDLYFLRMKSTLSEMASTYDLYSLLSSQARDRPSYSSHSDRKERAEENAIEDTLSMKDRGKALNLTPVREFTSQCFSKEQLDHFRENCAALNQYLNLMTPPMPVNCLQLELDESKTKRYGSRTVNSSDTNLFPACSPRRGVRPLRLGSADFIKPGNQQTKERWSFEKRTGNDESSPQTSTVPGTLIVGSTISQQGTSSVNSTRVKNTGHRSPYVQYQRDNPKAPQHVSGKRFDSGERSGDATYSAKARLTYTQVTSPLTSSLTSENARPSDSGQAPCRTATMFDLQDPYMYPRREKVKTITLDVNHLGIRGQPLRQDDTVTIPYRGSRRTSVKS